MGRPTMIAVGTLGLYTETPLHCGAESATGYVDLPVQRERHTGYPLIPGSSLKGVLRDDLGRGKQLSEEDRLSEEEIRHFFGADTSDESSPSPGHSSFGDGFLAAFPIRSSQTPFHWVTCSFILERISRTLGGGGAAVSPPERGEAWAKEDGEVLLEELRLTKKASPELFDEAGNTPLTQLLRLLPGEERGFGYTRRIFPDRLLVVRDEDFKELVEIGTEVLTRIKLSALGTTTDIPEGEHPEITGADRQGNLFVEEVVPPETLFLASLRVLKDPDRLTRGLSKLHVFRVGGDETIGRGVTHLTWVPADGTEEG